MRPRLLLLVFLLAATGGVLWLAVAQRGAAQAADRRRDELRQQQGRLRLEIEAMERRLAENEAEQARLALPPAAPAPRPATGSPGRVVQTPEGFQEFQRRLAADPKLQNDYLERARRRFAGEYSAFIAQSNLPEADASQFVENLVRHYAWAFELGLVEQKQSGLLTEAVVWRFREQEEEKFHTAQRALLGDAGYEKYDRYRRTLSLRGFVDALAGKATLAGAPISAAEADVLLAALIDASPLYRAGQVATTADVEWQGVVDVAKKLLAPQQFAVFEGRAIPIWHRERLNALACQK